MSFHKRKKKQTINSSAVVLTSTPENPISFPASLPSGTYSVCEVDKSDQIGKSLAASHASDSNGVAKMTCDNNNKDGHPVVSLVVENGQDKANSRHDPPGEAEPNDLKNQVANHSDTSQHQQQPQPQPQLLPTFVGQVKIG